MSKKVIAYALISVLVVVGSIFVYSLSGLREASIVNNMVDRNMEARGGTKVWKNITALKLTGRMDLGQGMVVPYVLEQKRPGKMCFEFVFDKQKSVQCTDGDKGWKLAPFRGRDTAEPMTQVELRETADSTDPYGLLYNYEARGTKVEMLGNETVDGRDTVKLKLTLAKGGVRWLYLDAETGLEIKSETMRTIAGRPRRVETYYSNWQKKDGLLIARRQETTTEGDPKPHFLTVESVIVNPQIPDTRFIMPTGSGQPNIGNTKSKSL